MTIPAAILHSLDNFTEAFRKVPCFGRWTWTLQEDESCRTKRGVNFYDGRWHSQIRVCAGSEVELMLVRCGYRTARWRKEAYLERDLGTTSDLRKELELLRLLRDGPLDVRWRRPLARVRRPARAPSEGQWRAWTKLLHAPGITWSWSETRFLHRFTVRRATEQCDLTVVGTVFSTTLSRLVRVAVQVRGARDRAPKDGPLLRAIVSILNSHAFAEVLTKGRRAVDGAAIARHREFGNAAAAARTAARLVEEVLRA